MYPEMLVIQAHTYMSFTCVLENGTQVLMCAEQRFLSTFPPHHPQQEIVSKMNMRARFASACHDHSMWKVEAGGSGIQVYAGANSKFEASTGNRGSC